MNLNFWISTSSDFFIPFSLFLISMGFSALSHWRYSFIHFFIIIETITLNINIILVSIGVIMNSIEGELFVIFSIAITAAETAIGLSLFISLIVEKPRLLKK